MKQEEEVTRVKFSVHVAPLGGKKLQEKEKKNGFFWGRLGDEDAEKIKIYCVGNTIF